MSAANPIRHQKIAPPPPAPTPCQAPRCSARHGSFGFTIDGKAHHFCFAHRAVGEKLMEARR